MTRDTTILQLTRELIAFETTENHDDNRACVEWITSILRDSGFDVEHIAPSNAAPLLIARRPPTPGGQGRVLVYNHYDVDEPHEDWNTPPFTATHIEDRLFGCGIGDNKGALAARLAAIIEHDAPAPELCWVIQGQEESGSQLARGWFRELDPALRWDLWIEENGWEDPDGTARVLAGERVPEGDFTALDATASARVMDLLDSSSRRARVEARMMNKSLVPGGCPFQASLPPGARYLSIGTNDAKTRIHATNESISSASLFAHSRDFSAVLSAVATGALG